MCHAVLQDPAFFHVLTRIDEELARRVRRLLADALLAPEVPPPPGAVQARRAAAARRRRLTNPGAAGPDPTRFGPATPRGGPRHTRGTARWHSRTARAAPRSKTRTDIRKVFQRTVLLLVYSDTANRTRASRGTGGAWRLAGRSSQDADRYSVLRLPWASEDPCAMVHW